MPSFVEIEVETLDQLKEALDAGARMVLLDNMGLPTLQEAVRINAGRAILEISGGVTLDGLRALAETGVDRISIGTLTKDVQATDYSMRFDTLCRSPMMQSTPSSNTPTAVVSFHPSATISVYYEQPETSSHAARPVSAARATPGPACRWSPRRLSAPR
jgi:hypothetical protein